MKKYFLSLLIVFAATHAFADRPICEQLKTSIRVGTPKQKLDRFFDLYWKNLLIESPEYATYVGEKGQNDRWSDLSLTAIADRKKESFCKLEILKQISSKNFRGEDKISYDMLKHHLELDIEGQKFASDYLVLDQLGGIHQTLADILFAMPAANEKDYRDMLSRLDLFPALVDQEEILLREGLKKKVTAVRALLSGVPKQIDNLLTDNIEDSPFFKVFKDMNSEIPAAVKSEIQNRAKELLRSKVYPRLKNFRKFVVDDYIPGARESIAASELPNGKDWYDYLIEVNTTTKMTADELHQLGIKEVERISKEMAELRARIQFKKSPEEFDKFLLTDAQFFYTKKEDLLAGYRDIAKRIDPELPKLFKTLPRLTYGVHEIPEFKSKESMAAYYDEGSIESGRPGFFCANTYDLKSRPKWMMEALTMHEAVPGHHLQIALSQEITGLPKFRTQDYNNAFVEGWGLYAERLGEEIGFYKDPYSKYGELSMEMWRAVRLVVDTGMHSKSWSRDQAIQYMRKNVPRSQHEIEVEIDRYITWPGQALAYKVGQLKFLELRARAKSALGEKFNLREFHDEVLRHGALPMNILDQVVSDWIKSKS